MSPISKKFDTPLFILAILTTLLSIPLGFWGVLHPSYNVDIGSSPGVVILVMPTVWAILAVCYIIALTISWGLRNRVKKLFNIEKTILLGVIYLPIGLFGLMFCIDFVSNISNRRVLILWDVVGVISILSGILFFRRLFSNELAIPKL